MSTDPIADMLCRIRNANERYHEKVDIPSSNIKLAIAKILKEEGYIRNYKIIEDYKQNILRIYLKYGPNKERVIREIKRISRPGRRKYRHWNEIPKVYSGQGIVIVSTSKGLMTDREARRAQLGGEIICSVW